MSGISVSYVVRVVGFSLLALIVVRYFSSHFTGSGLLERANDAAISDGCGAAMPLYDRAIEFGAGFDGYTRRGACRIDLKQYDAALSDWSEAASIDPKNPGLHLSRARLLQRLARSDEALREYDRAAALDSTGTEIRLLRADFLRSIGNLDAATVAYGELMTQNDAPNTSSRATFRYAELQLMQGDAKGAAATVDEGLKQWPDDALGLYERGVFRLIIEGRAGDAADDLARSVEAGAKYRMVSILLNTGIAELTDRKADQSSYFAFAEPYIPIAIDAILFLDAARSKAGQGGSEELAKNFGDIEFALRPTGSLQPIKLVGWPIPIVKFYLDEIGHDELMVQAEKSESAFAVPPVCSANFFASIRPEKGTDPQEVKRGLQFAADNCPDSSLERALAIAELGRSTQ